MALDNKMKRPLVTRIDEMPMLYHLKPRVDEKNVAVIGRKIPAVGRAD
jgi:hypothetical protein